MRTSQFGDKCNMKKTEKGEQILLPTIHTVYDANIQIAAGAMVKAIATAAVNEMYTEAFLYNVVVMAGSIIRQCEDCRLSPSEIAEAAEIIAAGAREICIRLERKEIQ